MNDILESFASRQFIIWLLIFVPALVVGVLVVETLALEPKWAFMAGVALPALSRPFLDALIDWYVAEREVEDFHA